MMAYEGLMAFFLESTFLGILLFGRRLVPTWARFFAALMAAFGTLLSSFWILSTNSWMQTPRDIKLSMVDSSRSTGLQSSLIRHFLIEFFIT
jgi:cytochrome d ubiquinol oxidase subunit I